MDARAQFRSAGRSWALQERRRSPGRNKKKKFWRVLAILRPSGMQRKLSEAGFSRSIAAIQVKVNRSRIKANLEGYSACQLADALGVDVRKVLRWIQQRFLKAERRGTERTP